jgi:hypothetical protein
MKFHLSVLLLLAFFFSTILAAPVRRATGDATFFHTGLGACGKVSNDSQLVCALPGAVFDKKTPNGNPNKNPLCGRKVKVTRGGKSVTVRVVDRCGPCKSNDIDLSPTAFGKLASLGVGRTQVTWKFV